MRSSRPCAPVPRFSILPPPVVRKNRTRASTHAQRLVVVVTTSSFFGRHPVVGPVREWRSGRSSPLLPFVSGGRDPSPERIATTKRSLRREISRRHEHPSQSAREEDSARGGNRVSHGGTSSCRTLRYGRARDGRTGGGPLLKRFVPSRSGRESRATRDLCP